MTRAEYEAAIKYAKEDREPWITLALFQAKDKYIESLESENARLSKSLENSVSKFELDTCRALNEALRQRDDRMRKAMLNAGFVWSEDEFKEIEK